MKKILIGLTILCVSMLAYITYSRADLNNISVSILSNTLTQDKHAIGDVYITNRNNYSIKNVSFECVGATDNPNSLVEVFSKTYNILIPANSSKTFKNEYLGHYSSKVIMVICVEVTAAQRSL